MHTYALSLRPLLFHDKEDIALREIDALVRSGDYFTLLASKLDEVSQELEKTKNTSYLTPTLQQLVEDLLHLQEDYVITKK